MKTGMDIAFFGSSLVSAYWNGAATYYRGIIRALAGRGHRVTFYEPDAFGRQQHRDIEPPEWATAVVYSAAGTGAGRGCGGGARDAGRVVKARGVGVFGALVRAAVHGPRTPRKLVAVGAVDAPATLERARQGSADPFGPL